MTEVIIDGKRVQSRNGEYLLAVARRAGIEIPTLCHHEAIEPSGSCRLCMVEITKPEWDGWSKLVTACLYPVEEGLVVATNSAKVRRTRKEILELLLARSPNAEPVRKLAAEYGVLAPSYPVDGEGDNCILCDICTRICQERVTGAIARINRGVEKIVATPFDEASDACIGCGSCARSCPTNAIEMTEDGFKRTIWGKTFELVPCKVCGAPTIPMEQAAWVEKTKGIPRDEQFVCDKCKARQTAASYNKIAW